MDTSKFPGVPKAARSPGCGSTRLCKQQSQGKVLKSMFRAGNARLLTHISDVKMTVLLCQMSWVQKQKPWCCPMFYMHCPPKGSLTENLATICSIRARTAHPLLALSLLHRASHMLLKLLGYLSAFTSSRKSTMYFTCSLLKQFFQLNLSHKDKGHLTGCLPTCLSGQDFLPCCANWWQCWHPMQLLGQDEGD